MLSTDICDILSTYTSSIKSNIILNINIIFSY